MILVGQAFAYNIFSYRKSNIVEHTTVLHSTGWPDGYSSAKDCKHVILNAGKLEMRIVVMDLDVNNRATYGCDGQDDYIQIRGILRFYM